MYGKRLGIYLCFICAITANAEADMFKEGANLRPLIEGDSQDVIESGYQRVIVSTGSDIRACESTLSGRLAKSLFKYGNTAALTILIDNFPIAAYVYDTTTNTCTKLNNTAIDAIPYKRIDIAKKEQHKLTIAYLSTTKVETLKEIVNLSSEVAALNGYLLISPLVTVPLSTLTTKVDTAIASAKSSNNTNETLVYLPSKGNKHLIIKLSIDGGPYQTLGEIVVSQRKSLLKGLKADDVIFEQILSDTSIDDQLRTSRNGLSIRDYKGNVKIARQECDIIRAMYSKILTPFDLHYLLESYLTSTHRGYLNASFLNACFGTNDESELTVYSLREEMINSRLSSSDQRGTAFMRRFTPSSASPPFDLGLKIDFAPLRFHYRTAEELRTSQNQREAGCYQFSKSNARQFYFTKTVDGTVYYFKTTVDQSYSTQEEDQGSQSSITSMVVTDDLLQLGDEGEYAAQSERCIKNYEVSSR